MKRLLLAVFIMLGLLASTAHAQTVNTRTFTIDPPPAVLPVGTSAPTGWRIYCGATVDPTTFAAAPIKDIVLPAVTSGPIVVAAGLNYCAAKFYNASLESAFSNVVGVLPPSSPTFKVTTIDTFVWDAGSQEIKLVDHSVTVQNVSVR